MFYVAYNDLSIHDPASATSGNPVTYATAAKLKMEVNSAGSLSFTIPYNHFYRNMINMLSGKISVRNDNQTVFTGRIIAKKTDMIGNITYTCEGMLATLHDTFIPPFTHSGTPSDWLDHILSVHNSQVDSSHQMTRRLVNVSDPYGILTGTAYFKRSWDVLKEQILDSDIGGYIVPRYINGVNNIDFLSTFTETNTQKVEYAKNLLDITEQIKCDDVYSAIIPIGSNNITLAPLTDGDIDDDLFKLGYTVQSRSRLQQFGYIAKLENWTDMSNRTQMQNRAADQLRSVVLPESFTVSAVDLHCIDDSISALNLGCMTDIVLKDGTVLQYPLTEMNIDLMNPAKSTVTFGKTEKGISKS